MSDVFSVVTGLSLLGLLIIVIAVPDFQCDSRAEYVASWVAVLLLLALVVGVVGWVVTT